MGYWKRRLSTTGRLDKGTKDVGDKLGLPANVQAPMTVELCSYYLSVAWKSGNLTEEFNEMRENIERNS